MGRSTRRSPPDRKAKRAPVPTPSPKKTKKTKKKDSPSQSLRDSPRLRERERDKPTSAITRHHHRSSPTPVLSAAYLSKSKSKNDLVRRLRAVVEALSDDDVEPDSADYPGLAGLAAALVEERHLEHRDKEVRLHTVLACMEIFYLYAPDPPWDAHEILSVFRQTVRQLANLAHCTSPSRPNFHHYFRLLEQLSAVKIGVVLVELWRTCDSGEDELAGSGAEAGRGCKEKEGGVSDGEGSDDGQVKSEEALECLRDLVRTILRSVRVDHPPEVSEHAEGAVSACLEEFDSTVPIPVLDEVLLPIAAGPVVYVTNPKAVEAAARAAERAKKGKNAKGKSSDKKGKGKGKDNEEGEMPPMQIQQTNQSYVVAASVIRRTEARISSPVAALLNGLLNGEHAVTERTEIMGADAVNATPTSAAESGKPRGDEIAAPSSGADVYSVIYELHRVSPPILTTVIGTLSSSLQSPSTPLRLRVSKLLGRLFYSPQSNIATQFRPCFREWLRRSNDVDGGIRGAVVKCLSSMLANKGTERELIKEAGDTLGIMIRMDPSLDVRLLGVHNVCDLAHNEKRLMARTQLGPMSGGGSAVQSALAKVSGDVGGRGAPPASYGANSNGAKTEVSSSSTSDISPSLPVVSASLLRSVGNRVSSKNKTERRDAVTGLAQIYYRHYVAEKLRDVQAGGDDASIEVVMDTLRKGCGLDADGDENEKNATKYPKGLPKSKEGKRSRGAVGASGGPKSSSVDDPDMTDPDLKYGWIPRLIFESACFTDTVDPEMRNRVVQIVDDVLLGTSSSPSKSKPSKSKKNELTATARAVGQAIIVHLLKREEGADCDGLGHRYHYPVNGKSGSGASAGKSNAYKWMCTLLAQRASLQGALGKYIEARGRAKQLDEGSEEALTAEAEATEQLEVVASLTTPPLTSGADLPSILHSLHTARDRHIFRLLSTISAPVHSPSARIRAFDELPKRTKSLGDATSSWVKSLARRCAMGHFVNAEIVTHSILLAQECFQEGDVCSAVSFLECVKMAVTLFPTLGGTREGFATLVELFGECRNEGLSAKVRDAVARTGMVTLLSRILASAAPARAASVADTERQKSASKSPSSSSSKDKERSSPTAAMLEPALQSQLLRLCTRDGTPEQARHAVLTLAALAGPSVGAVAVGSSTSSSSSIPELQAAGGGGAGEEWRSFDAEMDSLLRALTSPSRLTIGGGGKNRVVSVLTALAALAEVAPRTFGGSRGGERAVRLAMEGILLGRAGNGDDEEEEEGDGSEEEDENDDGSGSEDEDESDSGRSPKQSRRRQSQSKRKSSKKSGSRKPTAVSAATADMSNLSPACERACAAVELLVSHIRSATSYAIKAKLAEQKRRAKEVQMTKQQPNRKGEKGRRGRSSTGEGGTGASDRLELEVKQPTHQHIASVFFTLVQIIRDAGLPPSARDRKEFGSSSGGSSRAAAANDRAALRRCCAVNLLRLCDPALQLEGRYLSYGAWHVLASIFLDPARSVRSAAMEELSLMLTGSGKYRSATSASFAPNLRFLAYAALCPDGDDSRAVHSSANGGAANVGKRALSTKNTALQCVTNLRRTAQTTLARCRAIGPDAERHFEERLKILLVPEFALPFALHLLAFRRETPSAGGIEAGASEPRVKGKSSKYKENEEEEEDDDETDKDYDEDALVADEETRQRMLRKRLKYLIEPLVESLGEGADNISFLLRMSEVLGNKYQPIDVTRGVAPSTSPSFNRSADKGVDKSVDTSLGSLSGLDISLDISLPSSPMRSSMDKKRDQESHAKLKIICAAAREVLLKFVKKDVNLTPYPGAMQIPGSLFVRAATAIPAAGVHKHVEGEKENKVSQRGNARGETRGRPKSPPPPLSGAGLSAGKRKRRGLSSLSPERTHDSAIERHVAFSPDLEDRRTFSSEEPGDAEKEGAAFSGDKEDSEKEARASRKTTTTAAGEKVASRRAASRESAPLPPSSRRRSRRRGSRPLAPASPVVPPDEWGSPIAKSFSPPSASTIAAAEDEPEGTKEPYVRKSEHGSSAPARSKRGGGRSSKALQKNRDDGYQQQLQTPTSATATSKRSSKRKGAAGDRAKGEQWKSSSPSTLPGTSTTPPSRQPLPSPESGLHKASEPPPEQSDSLTQDSSSSRPSRQAAAATRKRIRSSLEEQDKPPGRRLLSGKVVHGPAPRSTRTQRALENPRTPETLSDDAENKADNDAVSEKSAMEVVLSSKKRHAKFSPPDTATSSSLAKERISPGSKDSRSLVSVGSAGGKAPVTADHGRPVHMRPGEGRVSSSSSTKKRAAPQAKGGKLKKLANRSEGSDELDFGFNESVDNDKGDNGESNGTEEKVSPFGVGGRGTLSPSAVSTVSSLGTASISMRRKASLSPARSKTKARTKKETKGKTKARKDKAKSGKTKHVVAPPSKTKSSGSSKKSSTNNKTSSLPSPAKSKKKKGTFSSKAKRKSPSPIKAKRRGTLAKAKKPSDRKKAKVVKAKSSVSAGAKKRK